MRTKRMRCGVRLPRDFFRDARAVLLRGAPCDYGIAFLKNRRAGLEMLSDGLMCGGSRL